MVGWVDGRWDSDLLADKRVGLFPFSVQVGAFWKVELSAGLGAFGSRHIDEFVEFPVASFPFVSVMSGTGTVKGVIAFKILSFGLQPIEYDHLFWLQPLEIHYPLFGIFKYAPIYQVIILFVYGKPQTYLI